MIQDNTGATPKLDEYRKQVFLGLQELQTRVDEAGGIEALFAPLLDDQGKHWITYVSAAWSWSKQAVEFVSHPYSEFPAEFGGDLIRLAGWDSEEGGDYLGILGEVELDVSGAQAAWVSILYPEDRSEVHRFEDALALIQNGGVPRDIEWEALCVTTEQLLLWLGHEERSRVEWNSHLYGSWGGSSTDRWADSFCYPALLAALKHFRSDGMLIDDDMNEHQARMMSYWL